VRVLEMSPFRFRARQPGQRLKIGYVSSDFGNHPLSHLMQVCVKFPLSPPRPL
jgi:protein O-GlcNAc transferase